MKKLVVGILAHVDAGKTTLSEGLLYRAGALRRLGRVDHRDAFLDTDAQERERGITIFSKQAEFTYGDAAFTLLDTPGHVDFSAEMERTLGVLDCAILVISGTDGVQGHTRTLWRLLTRRRIPTFLFVNKMDLAGADREAVLSQLQTKLDGGCLDFSAGLEPILEDLASLDEELMDRYLEGGKITAADAAGLVARRLVFPCFFGSALRLEGVEELLEGLSRYTAAPSYPPDFAAKVFKIARDGNDRLTYLKVTGGCLRVRTLLGEEKVNQIRIYSGEKYRTVDEAPAGTVCALTGPTKTRPGDALGAEPPAPEPELEPVLTYQVVLPPACDVHTMLKNLRLLEEEDPQLRVVWNEALGEIHLQLMGEVQLEVLTRLIRERFGVEVSFGVGSIVYRETITNAVEGVGQGLMQAESILLEPYYDFTLELPPDCVGRAMNDLQTMGGSVEGPEQEGELALLTGHAPVAGLRDYWREVAAYTRGRGRLSCALRGYEPCADQAGVIGQFHYDPERDVENPPDSVFCSHGAGVNVKWYEVRDHMHVDSGLRLGAEAPAPKAAAPAGGARQYQGGSLEQDRELLAVFERTYGKVDRDAAFQPQRRPARTSLDEERYTIREQKSGPEYLLVDGYNIIFAWDELKELARTDVAAARTALENILSNYQGFRQCVVILVFDAYKVKGNPGSVEKRENIYVVYTKEAETADAYIEKATYDLGREHRVRVATSDGLEQMIILGHGALRLSARAFKAEVEQTQGEIAALVERHNRRNRELGRVKHTAKITRNGQKN